ncbi:hypothetical protein DAEQUDRAFT_345943 [Daedalea quercina L-15889]|uniref:Uncharacterized protein n=1 Tax=Daedalea quercina L-15889 TaxID=1314783 RepID=A0A165PBW7_9APHY|nr:hypothetical protein DAEQUDRAFT_345943 [Daedalea quercina L-15889]
MIMLSRWLRSLPEMTRLGRTANDARVDACLSGPLCCYLALTFCRSNVHARLLKSLVPSASLVSASSVSGNGPSSRRSLVVMHHSRIMPFAKRCFNTVAPTKKNRQRSEMWRRRPLARRCRELQYSLRCWHAPQVYMVSAHNLARSSRRRRMTVGVYLYCKLLSCHV